MGFLSGWHISIGNFIPFVKPLSLWQHLNLDLHFGESESFCLPAHHFTLNNAHIHIHRVYAHDVRHNKAFSPSQKRARS